MRASTLFALTIAILVGLAVAIAIRMSGYFTLPSAPEQAKKQDIQVLVAAKNVFAGDMLDTGCVRLRPIKTEELAHYQEHKSEYLAPSVQAANLRIAKTNIEAEQPVLKNHLTELSKPEALNTRLLQSMRAVNVTLTKDRSAGGMILVGDWVDVFVTSEIQTPQGDKVIRTACLVPGVRVVAKRNTLWPIFAPLPENKPVQYTLEVNPYRGALLDFVNSRGQLLLMPLPGADQKKLESQRQVALELQPELQPVHFLQQVEEGKLEDGRVAAILRGDSSVGEQDLVRIFGMTTPPPPVATPTVTIQRITGITTVASEVFLTNGQRVPPTRENRTAERAAQAREGQAQATSNVGFRFAAPDCSNCGPQTRRRVGG